MSRLPPFDDHWPSSRRDVLLLLNSHVHQTESVLLVDEVADLLAGLGYQLIEFDASSWTAEQSMHDSLATALQFPDYNGKNLDALNDAMRGVALFEHGSDPASTGTALVLRNFESFASRFERSAQILLDIIASQARVALLVDHPILCVVQASEDRWFDPVGGLAVTHLWATVPQLER